MIKVDMVELLIDKKTYNELLNFLYLIRRSSNYNLRIFTEDSTMAAKVLEAIEPKQARELVPDFPVTVMDCESGFWRFGDE